MIKDILSTFFAGVMVTGFILIIAGSIAFILGTILTAFGILWFILAFLFIMGIIWTVIGELI